MDVVFVYLGTLKLGMSYGGDMHRELLASHTLDLLFQRPFAKHRHGAHHLREVYDAIAIL